MDIVDGRHSLPVRTGVCEVVFRPLSHRVIEPDKTPKYGRRVLTILGILL
ncbi:hypothetical protein HSR121_1285 [Halapricum desulfuricans]|uniref:Uncharacterized protein n=1 Tax=Halapricum desulfuricans TaxID=2841257 RepID=A0A897MZC7_9EURY|nr:hypothetical protein HSR121_1285 [Halapricum desulfuricans]